MEYPIVIEQLRFGLGEILIAKPEESAVKADFDALPNSKPFPFWARIWPSAYALASFIDANPEIIAGKKVWEIGAGLGLPSLLAAKLAKKITLSDIDSGGISYFHKSLILNKLQGCIYNFDDFITCTWPDFDVCIASDINYKEENFEPTILFVEDILRKDKKLILSTPQRLHSNPFIAQLKYFPHHYSEILINGNVISIFAFSP